MHKKDWLSLVAVHSDAWLLAVAFYYGAKLDAPSRYSARSRQRAVLFSARQLSAYKQP